MHKQPLIKQGWIRVLVFVIVLVITNISLALAAGVLLTAWRGGDNNAENASGVSRQWMLLSLLLNIAGSAVVVFLFRKLIDKQTLKSLGWELRGYRNHAATGFFLGLFLLGAGSFVLIINKNLYWTGIIFDLNQLFVGLVLMAMVAFTEELVFRGYILNNLMLSMNSWTALILSAALFALFHGSNPEISLPALLNIFLSGLLLGINYIFTKNLWYAFLLHFSWNFYQGPILGYKVSGLKIESLLQQQMTGNVLLTGGDFGFEGSMIVALLCIISFLVLAIIYKRKPGAVLPSSLIR